ncbi:OmpA family protein [Fulvivirgaceae bacterium BMA10]|uniref:OmpA family protein n=1 Tax=Splendidivirga corallicola TaxID=3051826 RepID=A0ABT8KMM2_9BACT|nr:OmpA family protein [Fulvivirgaceae bacterium BMA10]
MKKALFVTLFSFFSIACFSQEPALIKSIYFGGGSYYIDLQQKQELHYLLDSIPNIEAYQITIHSHTDNIGGAEYNEWLSMQRSNSALRQLLLKNIPKEVISIEDFGQFNPVYDNSTHLGRMRNRRVDIIFWPIVL